MTVTNVDGSWEPVDPLGRPLEPVIVTGTGGVPIVAWVTRNVDVAIRKTRGQEPVDYPAKYGERRV
jgi:hypothetical protein